MIRDNPFYVLGVAPDASRIAIEREAQKLLGMLELGFADAQTYQTPLGPAARTPEAVRAAVAALRDPQRRLVAELWARHAPAPGAAAGAVGAPAAGAQRADSDRDSGGGGDARPGLRRALGWRP